jgi:hypothetical protein
VEQHAMVDFLWFLSSTTVRAGLIPLIIIACVVAVAALLGRRLSDYRERKSIVFFVGAFFVVSIFVWLWSKWWWQRDGMPNPDWVEYPMVLALIFQLVLSVWLVWQLRGMRLFAAAFSVMNLYFALWMSFFALMSINRDYWHLGMS